MAIIPVRVRTSLGAVVLAVPVAALAISVPAAAGALRILPVRIEVPSQKQFCSLSVANDAKDLITVQVRGFGWSQSPAGSAILDPATGPLVNPAIVSIPGGATRMVRCSLPVRPGAVEDSYRIIINELPVASVAPGTVRALLQISIPLFRAPAGAAPVLHWSLAGSFSGSTSLEISNSGSRHIQVLAIKLRPKSAADKVVRLTGGFYLLAGGRIVLQLASVPTSGIAEVEVESADGHLTASPAAPRASGD